jgi:uncharacterized protein YndB with AHSA1/START domain
MNPTPTAQAPADITTEGAQLVITKTFAAPAALVFEAMTNPDHIRQWWGAGHGEVTTCEVDLRVGGHYHFAQTGADGQEVSFSGEYLQIDPPGHLVHTEVFDNINSEPSVIDTTYTESDGLTTLRAVITYDSPETVQIVLDSGMEHGLQSSYEALQQVLDGLKAA